MPSSGEDRPPLPGGAKPLTLTPLFARLTEEQAWIYRLVLSAEGIPFRMKPQDGFWIIETSPGYRQAAVQAVSAYLGENEPSAESAPVPVYAFKRNWAAAYPALLILLFHWLLRPGFERDLFLRTYAADAGAILNGQGYRCVTALLFHADGAHLLGNIAGLLLFGSVVAGVCGGSLGWLLILVSGALGNLATAFWHGHDHVAIGASTAVFGALGIGVALRIGLEPGSVSVARRVWLPLAAGLALLGFLGTAAQSDLLAHFFGFIAGLGLGWLQVRWMPPAIGWQGQAAALLLILLILTGSWGWGLTTLSLSNSGLMPFS